MASPTGRGSPPPGAGGRVEDHRHDPVADQKQDAATSAGMRERSKVVDSARMKRPIKDPNAGTATIPTKDHLVEGGSDPTGDAAARKGPPSPTPPHRQSSAASKAAAALGGAPSLPAAVASSENPFADFGSRRFNPTARPPQPPTPSQMTVVNALYSQAVSLCAPPIIPPGQGNFGPEEFQSLVTHLLATDSRFVTGDARAADNPATRPLAHPVLKYLSGVSAAEAGIKQETSELKAFRDTLLDHLVYLHPRTTDSVTFSATGIPRTYQQVPGSVGVTGEGADRVYSMGGPTSPSSVAAKERVGVAGLGYTREQPPNLYTLFSSTDRPVVSRSARTNTPATLENLLIHNALATLQGSRAPGTAAAPLEFRMAVTTAMDASWKKAVAGKAKDAVMGIEGEDERQNIEDMRAAVVAVFGDKKFKDVKMCFKDDLGRDVVKHVRIFRPSIINITLSGQSKDPANIDGHRAITGENWAPLAESFADAWKAKGGVHKLVMTSLEACRGEKAALETAFATIQADLMRAGPMSKQLSPSELLALNAYKLVLTGSTLDGSELKESTDPLREFMLMCHLADAAGVHLSVQCKSGIDRTVAMAASRIAMEEFKLQTGRDFNPITCVHPDFADDLQTFRKLFAKAADELGKNVAGENRGRDEEGKAKIKFWSHPSTQFFLKGEIGSITGLRLPKKMIKLMDALPDLRANAIRLSKSQDPKNQEKAAKLREEIAKVDIAMVEDLEHGNEQVTPRVDAAVAELNRILKELQLAGSV